MDKWFETASDFEMAENIREYINDLDKNCADADLLYSVAFSLDDSELAKIGRDAENQRYEYIQEQSRLGRGDEGIYDDDAYNIWWNALDFGLKHAAK